MLQQRSPSPGDGAGLETQQRRDARVAAAPGLQGFEPGIQAPWSLDGGRVFYGSGSPPFGLFSRSADGSGEQETLLTSEQNITPYSWTPDGQGLTYYIGEVGSGDIGTASLDGDPSPYLANPAYQEGNHDLSSDGRWMAYNSNESGQLEVYIERYPERGEKVTVSTGGGVEPLWSGDGSELFYRNLTGDRMMVVAVTTEPNVRVSRPQVLFEGQYAQETFFGRARGLTIIRTESNAKTLLI